MKKIISIILTVILTCSMFSLTASAEGIYGDANGDGNVTAVDARLVLQVVAGLKQVEDQTLYDVNGDGNVTAVDARIILQIVAGLLEDPAKKEQIEYFVNSLNGVKENAKSVTFVKSKTYECEEYSGSELFKDFYDEMKQDMFGEVEVNETYTGEDIAAKFPPAGVLSNLKPEDVSSISFKDFGDYYRVAITVKGEINPTRGEGVGAVSSIITKEDLEAQMAEEGLEGMMEIDCKYKDVTVKAKIEKATGNMIEYYVDTPMILQMSAGTTEINIGIGVAEEWTATY